MKTTTMGKKVLISAPASAKSAVLNAVHALYYLPLNYTLVYAAQDAPLYQEIVGQRRDLAERIVRDAAAPDMVIRGSEVVSAQDDDHAAIYNASPEAVASAILRVAQAV